MKLWTVTLDNETGEIEVISADGFYVEDDILYLYNTETRAYTSPVTLQASSYEVKNTVAAYSVGNWFSVVSDAA